MGCQGRNVWFTIWIMSTSKSKSPKVRVPNHGAKLKSSTGNPDHSRRTQAPALQDPEIEARLQELVEPAVFAELAHYQRLGMRNRILSLPVMVSLVLTMMWRNVPSVRTLVRMLREERLLWMWSAPTPVSQPSLSERFLTFPAELMKGVFERVIEQLPSRVAQRNAVRPFPPTLASIATRFPSMYALDGSTLEALFRKLASLQEEPYAPLGGHMAAACNLLSHLPEAVWYDDDSACDDKTLLPPMLDWLLERPTTLLCFDLGYFAFTLFDDLTERQCYYVTRLREKTRYTVQSVLLQRPYVRDCIISMGFYRSNPCKHPARLIEVCIEDEGGKKVWHQYLTNVLDPQMLSVEEVVEVYRNRWCIETAFKETKRLLGLSYLWVGSRNGVELQMWGTWLFYCLLLDLCDDVAALLRLPMERISVEMVYRGLYHYVQALHNGVVDKDVGVSTYLAQRAEWLLIKLADFKAPSPVSTYLAQRAEWLGIIKHKRKSRPPNITARACAAVAVLVVPDLTTHVLP
jgi:hypothetical protein